MFLIYRNAPAITAPSEGPSRPYPLQAINRRNVAFHHADRKMLDDFTGEKADDGPSQKGVGQNDF